MPNVSIDKEAFKNLLDQFTCDIPYEVELLNKLLENIPDQVVDNLIMENYFSRCYRGMYFKAVHTTFKDDIHYFLNWESLKSFLADMSISTYKKSWSLVTNQEIGRYISLGKPLSGYIITKEESK